MPLRANDFQHFAKHLRRFSSAIPLGWPGDAPRPQGILVRFRDDEFEKRLARTSDPFRGRLRQRMMNVQLNSLAPIVLAA